MVLARIGITAMFFGVCTKTLRRWEASGKISCTRTAGGHRRFSIVEVRGLRGDEGNDKSGNGPRDDRIAVYCRVSSHEQKAKGDLDRQVAAATAHCRDRGLGVPSVFTDTGSGLSVKRAGLARLCKEVEQGRVGKVVLTFKDLGVQLCHGLK